MPGVPDPSTSEETLALEARDGNVRALEALLDRNQSRVLRILRLLGVPAQDRDDVAQEVFIRVFRHLGGFRPGRPFGAWLYRVTVNAAHDYRQRRGRHDRREECWEGNLDATADGRPGPEQAAEQETLRRELEAALEVLSERERAAFVLREMEGLETREVARALGVTSVTVRRHLGRARRHLRETLEAARRKNSPDR